MSVKSKILENSIAEDRKLAIIRRNQAIKFSLIVFFFAGLLVASMLNDFLFFEWLGLSLAIILSMGAIHILGEKQTKRS